MKKNRVLAGIMILLFICAAIFMPSINDIYNTTSKEIKDNLFKQRYLYKNTLFDINNGYLYTFGRNDGTVKNIYTNEEDEFEYVIKDDKFAVRKVSDNEYDLYDMTLYEDRIRIELDEENNIDLFFKDKKSESFDEFIFLESSDGAFFSDIHTNNIMFFYDNIALVSTETGTTQFDYVLSENILTLTGKKSVYYFIGAGQKQMKNYDATLLGLYLSNDIKNKLELSEDYGYVEIDNKACEFTYGVFDHYILCESSDGNRFIIDYFLDNNTFEIKILEYEGDNKTYLFTKVS